MQRIVKAVLENPILIKPPSTSVCVKNITKPIIRKKSCVHFQPQSDEGEKYSNGGGQDHTVRFGAYCKKSECPTTDCKRPCGEITHLENEGNFTHNPPKGKKSVFLDQKDYKGKSSKKGQHFVKTEEDNKPKIPVEETKTLTEDDLMPNKAADIYSETVDIFNKIK